MTKGYWIAHVTVLDAERYASYQSLARTALESFGATFVVRGGQSVQLEGPKDHQRHVIMAFKSYDQALECYHSPAYQKAKAAREGAAEVEITIMEGV